MNSDCPEIVLYHPSLKSFFKDLNEEWLNKYYFVTEEDSKILTDPEKIINDGGCVLFARLNNEIIGTCALIKESDAEYEIAKMGVAEKARGKKAGYELMKAIIEEAIKRKAKLVSLETAVRLEAAVSLYKKFNFIQVSEERIHSVFGRKTFRMELKI